MVKSPVMKLFLIAIFTFFGIASFAQQNAFKLSAQKQIISIHLNEDNSNRKITVDSKERIANVQRLSIRGLAPEADADWVRTFHIADSETAEARITIESDKGTSVFNYSLKTLLEKLKPGTYRIYTIAVPRDAAKAAELKPKRILVATLEVV
jgi:hypothetical protein